MKFFVCRNVPRVTEFLSIRMFSIEIDDFFNNIIMGTVKARDKHSINPDIQNKLKTEIENVFKETNGKLTYETINGMKYLEAVVAEILRLYQLAPFLDRVCVKDFEMPSATLHGEPFIVKSGGYIWFPSYSLHRDSKYFPELEKFNPDRFLNSDVDNSVIRNENRICIGKSFDGVGQENTFHNGGFWLKVQTRKQAPSIASSLLNEKTVKA
ncbi:hypothetical protein HN011_009864 [Eciton burchellii]|nr:hypothetical protein HN011_009864 [Eciton burchellii]